MNQLTLSLGYTWNEKGMIYKKKQKKTEEVGNTKSKNEVMPHGRKTKLTVFAICLH